MVKKGDIILFSALIALSVCLFVLIFFYPKANGKSLVITVGGKEYCRTPLFEDREIVLEQNTVIIKDGQAYMKSADCPDKICINQGKIEKAGETVVCIPGGVILEVE